MDCPFCRAQTLVYDTKSAESQVVRHRRCKGRQEHRFVSIETVPAALNEIAVWTTTGLLRGPLDPAKLAANLRAPTMLKSEQIGTTTVLEIVDAALSTVVATSHWHKPLSESQRRELPEEHRDRIRATVLDRNVVAAVDAQLEHHGLDAQRVLYGLTTRRPAGTQFVKWRNAREVLAWLSTIFPSARRAIPASVTSDRVYAWAVSPRPWTPRLVVKQNGRGNEVFSVDKFLASIALMFQGRSQRTDQNIADIAAFALAGMEGQGIVHSSQLSAAVLGCLRRVDDIAYLRCAVAVKGPLSASAIADEAEDLVVNPSPSLRFEHRMRITVEQDRPLLSGLETVRTSGVRS